MAEERPVIGVVLEPGDGPIPTFDALKDEADVRFVYADEGLADVIERVEALAVYDFRASRIRDLWPRAGRLKWLHAASAGLDAVLFPEPEASDVVITNSRGVFDRTIADFVLGAILIFVKDLHTTLELQRRHEWRHRESERLEGRTALIVGAGSIGRAIAKLLSCVGMRVTGVARSERTDDPDFGRVFSSNKLPELLPESDFVIISAPLTEETRGMFGPDEFALFKPGARLINIGRGPIVQEKALIEALHSGQVAGAALDVFEEEPLPAESPLWSLPNVIISPHMSGDFFGWREALAELFIENFRRWRRGEQMLNVIKEGKS